MPLVAGCTRADEQFVTSWFKVRTSPSPKIGDPSTITEYFVRRYGFFWRKIDDAAVRGATAINAKTVAYFDNDEARLIHQGEVEAIFVCGRGPAGVSFPTGAEAVDCVDALAGPTPAVATMLRFRRISASAVVTIEKTIAVEGPNRVFLQPMVTFYDEGATAYFATMRAGLNVTPNCALLAVGAGEVRSVAGSPTMELRDCSQADNWTPMVGRALRPSAR
jgi:hypothetical protein